MRQPVEEMPGITFIGETNRTDKRRQYQQQTQTGIEPAACHKLLPCIADFVRALELWLGMDQRHDESAKKKTNKKRGGRRRPPHDDRKI
jgi:hypothetical protein